MTEYHVIYSDEDREWKVKKAGNVKATATRPKKKPAEEKAKSLAKDNRPATVYTHYKAPGRDLKPVQDETSYPVQND